MRNDKYTPRLGMIAALCAVVGAIWIVTLYGFYHDTQEPKYNVRVRPGTVYYGTHSTAALPMVSAPAHRSAAPMISGAAVRSYAYAGHATLPAASSGSVQLHTTSSATVHTIGSGGTAGGGVSALSSGSGTSSRGSGSSSSRGAGTSSSRGIRYGGGGGVSMSGLAMVTPVYTSSAATLASATLAASAANPATASSAAAATAAASSAATAAFPSASSSAASSAASFAATAAFPSASSRYGIGPRRVHDNGNGGYDGDYDGEQYNEQWWSEDDEGWVDAPFEGCRKIEGDLVYIYKNGLWVLVENQADPTVPVGGTPCLFLLLLALAYALLRHRKAPALPPPPCRP